MATTEADLFARQESSETFGSKVWYVIRRWPVVPILILVALLVGALFAPILAPHDPIKQNLRSRLAPPAWAEEGTSANLLGADHVGRDILSRIIHGARISVTVVVIGLTAGTLLGSAIGILSGYYGGIVDEIVMFVVVVWIGVPFLMIALIVVSITGPSFGVVMTLANPECMDRIRAQRACRGVVPQGEGLRRSGPRRWRVHAQNHHQSTSFRA